MENKFFDRHVLTIIKLVVFLVAGIVTYAILIATLKSANLPPYLGSWP